jgi:hypothetical protein
MRCMHTAKEVRDGAANVYAQRRTADYRMQRLSRSSMEASADAMSGIDRSVITYTGHSVAQTLIRCDFSPEHSTGFKYVITGSADGLVHIYDVLTGEVVKKIEGHRAIVRDVAWHDQIIVSSSVRRREVERRRVSAARAVLDASSGECSSLSAPLCVAVSLGVSGTPRFVGTRSSRRSSPTIPPHMRPATHSDETHCAVADACDRTPHRGPSRSPHSHAPISVLVLLLRPSRASAFVRLVFLALRLSSLRFVDVLRL